MRTYKGNRLKVMTAEDYSAQMYNAPQALWSVNEQTGETIQLAVLGCGTADDVQLFTDNADEYIVIYSANDGIEYMAIEVFGPGIDTEKSLPGVFYQGEECRHLEDLQPITRARYMFNYWQEVNA